MIGDPRSVAALYDAIPGSTTDEEGFYTSKYRDSDF